MQNMKKRLKTTWDKNCRHAQLQRFVFLHLHTLRPVPLITALEAWVWLIKMISSNKKTPSGLGCILCKESRVVKMNSVLSNVKICTCLWQWTQCLHLFDRQRPSNLEKVGDLEQAWSPVPNYFRFLRVIITSLGQESSLNWVITTEPGFALMLPSWFQALSL